MTFVECSNVTLQIPRMALETIYDECDQHDRDETGGRIIGAYSGDSCSLKIVVQGVIEPGPSAERSPTYFMQDGEYQEKVFRKIEDAHPDIEHLGNWHTHHVNGLNHLSGGDLATYNRVVNHEMHNTDFFYALLVVSRNRRGAKERYTIKHYLFFRNDSKAYEIPQEFVEVIESEVVWPRPSSSSSNRSNSVRRDPVSRPPAVESCNMVRVYDQQSIANFFPSFRPFQSKKLGIYWKGLIALIDGEKLEVVVVEDASQVPTYSLLVKSPPDWLSDYSGDAFEQEYASATQALVRAERELNRTRFEISKLKP